MNFSNIMGILIGALVVGAVILLVHRINVVSEPCFSRNVSDRQVLIESHERCMTELNCIYEEWDIRKYDRRIATQEACKLED